MENYLSNLTLSSETIWVLAKSKTSFDIFAKLNKDLCKNFVFIGSANDVDRMEKSIVIALQEYHRRDENKKVRDLIRNRTDILLLRNWT